MDFKNNKVKLFKQISRFVVIGFLNTGVDFVVLNLLMWLTGIYKGEKIALLNTISFIVAAINSYLWNKFWVFKAREARQTGKVALEFSQFLIIAVIGAAINSAVVYGITTFIPSFFGISAVYRIFPSLLEIGPQIWANLAKAAATGVSLVWSFIGYKFIVFKE